MMVLLLLLLTLVTGEELPVIAGDLVTLYCEEHSEAKMFWQRDANQEMYLLSNMSAPEQSQMGVVVHGNSLVILSASVNHQGKYSCCLENTSSQPWYQLTVYPAHPKDDNLTYPVLCDTQKACQLSCPDHTIPPDIINSNGGIIWRKEDGQPSPENGYFSRVEEKARGVYTCTRSYLYQGHIYNMTFRVALDVRQVKNTLKNEKITGVGDEYVELGSKKVINCTAATYSCLPNTLFWLRGSTFVDESESSRVFYNTTCDTDTENIKMTASLVINEVSPEDLSITYTCKLESDENSSSFVPITLKQKARPSYISLALCIIGIVVVTVVTVVTYVKFKVDITLFLRDTLGCHRSTTDGKSYDAFLMCYPSYADEGLNAQDRNRLETVLEKAFGYSLCLYDRDVLPGGAIAEAVLDCVEQSRTVVLVPTSPDPGPGSGLLSAIHAGLVERQTRLVFINTETKEVPRSGSLPEALQLLSEAGDHVTWKGRSSMLPSSSFWKQLRYYLPAPQHALKINLLPQTVQDVTSWENIKPSHN